MNPPTAPIIERIIAATMSERKSAPEDSIDSSTIRKGMYATAEPRKPPNVPNLGLKMKKPHTIPAARGANTNRTLYSPTFNRAVAMTKPMNRINSSLERIEIASSVPNRILI